MTSHIQRSATDDLERQVLHNISDYGWHAVNVIEDNSHPPWTYTIGLYETWGFPELIIIGRSRATAHHILDTIALRLDADDHPDLNRPSDTLIPGASCHFIEVSPQHNSDYVGFARWFYRKRHFPLHQIIWPNNDGLHPWDPQAADSFKNWQPLLGPAPSGVHLPD